MVEVDDGDLEYLEHSTHFLFWPPDLACRRPCVDNRQQHSAIYMTIESALLLARGRLIRSDKKDESQDDHS